MHELFAALGRHASAPAGRPAFDDGIARLDHAVLARRVAGAAEEFATLAPSAGVVGLLGGNGVDWIVGLLAAWYAGRTVVPLPPFFRPPQLRHVVQDAGVAHVLTTAEMMATARLLGVPVSLIGDRQAGFHPAGDGAPAQIVYTSGSTGQPKGVLLGGAQMLWSAAAMARAIAAKADDTYLSLLPLPLLLETICAVMVPLLVGASVRLEPGFAAVLGAGHGLGIAALAAAHQPSCIVLVPELLAQWVMQLRAGALRAPDSLRFVAVGGAAVPLALAEQAWALGIPVHEGYGLSECGSVVALNRPGERKPGTVGQPLPGLDLRIEEGEIVVRGPSVMERYLHGALAQGQWRTGDAGEIDANGFLTVRGRLDNVLVTPLGRNVSPEWIESLLLADLRLAYCLVTHVTGPHLTAILVPKPPHQVWFGRASPDELAAFVAERTREAPGYATPRHVAVMPASDLVRFGLLTGNGRLRRKAALEVWRAALKPMAEESRAL